MGDSLRRRGPPDTWALPRAQTSAMSDLDQASQQLADLAERLRQNVVRFATPRPEPAFPAGKRD